MVTLFSHHNITHIQSRDTTVQPDVHVFLAEKIGHSAIYNLRLILLLPN